MDVHPYDVKWRFYPRVDFVCDRAAGFKRLALSIATSPVASIPVVVIFFKRAVGSDIRRRRNIKLVVRTLRRRLSSVFGLVPILDILYLATAALIAG